MFESTKMQTKLRTNEPELNDNISFPIGTIFFVDKLYEILNFSDIFGKHKTRGIDINNLLRALISYKLTDNFSIKRSHDWNNRPDNQGFAELKLRSRTVQTISASQKSCRKSSRNPEPEKSSGRLKKQRPFRRVLIRIRLFQSDSG